MKLRLLATSLIGAALMAACGGGDDDGRDTGSPATCSVSDRKAWLHDYMADWYFWYKLSPGYRKGLLVIRLAMPLMAFMP